MANNKNVDIYVLNDDRKNDCFLSEHGLSLFIDIDGKKILFDCGQTDNYINNAKTLNLNLEDVDAIVLSHGHYDHGNGLDFYKKQGKKLYMHPNCTAQRLRKSTGTYGGINLTKEELQDRFNVIECQNATTIFDGVQFLGQIERKINFEGKSFPTTNLDGSDDTVPDDSGIVIESEKGIIVITGCGHSGICNTIERAKKTTGRDDIYAVIGGFHLRKNDEVAKKTIEYFKDNNVQKIIMGHCTIDEVCDNFRSKLGEKVMIMHSGNVFKL